MQTLQTAFTFLRKGNRVQGEKATQRQESNQQRPFPSPSSSEGLHTNTAHSSWPVPGTPAHIPAAVYKQAPKHITVHFSNPQSRAESLQGLLHCNSPTSPEEYTAAAHPLPLSGVSSKLLLSASISTGAESLGRASRVAGQGGTGKMLLHFCKQQHGSVAFLAVPLLTHHGNILPCRLGEPL